MSNTQPAYLTVALQGKNLLEASAGTGKTFTVALLYLRALLGVGTPNNKPLDIEKILVVTFTNAATEELIDRIRLRIKEAIAYIDVPGSDKQLMDVLQQAYALHGDKASCKALLRTALSRVSFANISTIHKFCASLCESIAIDAGLPLAAMLSTDRGDISTSIKDLWRENVGQGDDYYQSKVTKYTDHESIYQKMLLKQASSLAKEKISLLKPDFFECLPDRSELEGFFKKYQTIYKSPYNNEDKIKKYLDDLYAIGHGQIKIQASVIKFFTASKLAGDGSFKKSADDSLLLSLKKEVANSKFFQLCETLHGTSKKNIPFVDLSYFNKSYRSLLNRLEKAESESELIYSDRLIQLAAKVSEDEAVATLIRDKLPLAIIDEFQDTDPFQYQLFNNIYSGENCGLLMVGDPKQAIYAFRGGDIYTYLQAKNDAQNTYNLPFNFRSASAVVKGINAIFEQAEAPAHVNNKKGAFNQPAIKFEPVEAKADKPLLMLECDGQLKPLEAVTGEYINDNADCSLNSAARQRICAQHAASYVDKLLSLADSGRCVLPKSTKSQAPASPLKRGDIAVLVNSHAEAKLLKSALSEKGIASLTHSKESIYQEPEAYDLWLILRAILEPNNQRYFEAALLASINGLGYQKAYQVINGEALLETWVATFHELHQVFLEVGPLLALTRWFAAIGATQSFMQLENDRQATNVMQLLELLQEDYALFGGGLKLLKRFERAIASDDNSDENLLRLESDEDRVKIMTIHASKGLEFPVVLVPFAWRDSVKVRDRLYSAHDEQGSSILGFGDEVKNAQKQELLDEKLRLFYVALTRASRHLVLLFIDSGKSTKKNGEQPSVNYNQSPLAWYFPTPNDKTSVSVAHQNFVAAMDKANEGCVNLHSCSINVAPHKDTEPLALQQRVCRVFDGKIDYRIGISSFSMITRNYNVVLKDAGESEGIVEETVKSLEPKGRHALAKGAHIGTALHNVLEVTDFTQWQTGENQKAKAALEFVMQKELKANGVIANAEKLEQALPEYTAWMTEVIRTPFLTDDSSAIALADLKSWQAELNFTFLLSPSFSKGGLRELLASMGYRLEGLSGNSIYGMLTGAIDLVFCHEGKYYLADYKSNYLGPDYDAYAEGCLANNNDAKAYTLQYLIYCLALHLHLVTRLPGYDYDKHFGGAFYLYMRGMHPQQPGKGVFFHQPTKQAIDKLSSYFLPTNKQLEPSV